jgi:hypothetical protein
LSLYANDNRDYIGGLIDETRKYEVEWDKMFGIYCESCNMMYLNSPSDNNNNDPGFLECIERTHRLRMFPMIFWIGL